ncbi:electron transport complex subunit RsxC [Pseudoalteromonas tunicata]|uniref:Ion-translocating oxidoreductase complex subunit C n=2 Tax=Pseudoalteromonas tunicata TaxID=314281 RepID=A4CB98_9GAMM|nr:electron transport complex subunit RsxC [Pseudoalteromonas tunicata]ATC94193.1 electron transport complex protein RnfC [Pseudoalteromonas tunicata]AXT29953.1 electron transport complex subunit RsxC [Pseudoalteromonas tunicata]EAR27635.1 electron transport complex protein RnfC [Pseudoalteromonas tunicata D2]
MDSLLTQIDNGTIWPIPGGIHPVGHKEQSSQTPIERLALPNEFVIPLKQHIGTQGTLLVNIGDRVLKGQALTEPKGHWALPVHAPTSGIISNIASLPSAHPSALPELSIVLTADNNDTWCELTPCDNYLELCASEIINKIRSAGISGMGGAGFATYVKAQPLQKIDYLIVNGVECEPYITSDDRLMQEHATTIIEGSLILAHVLKPERILIGIEDNKPEAIAAMQAAAKPYPHILIRVVPTKYPSGGEKQLIQLLTGQEVPNGKIPADIGIVVQNVATLFAIEQAVVHGKPLIERVVTITGHTIKSPGNAWVLLGTQVRELLLQRGFEPEAEQRVIMGGPMMGFTLPTVRVPVIKTTNCILAPSQVEQPFAGDEKACIRCSACADACPASLLPQQLQWFAKSQEFDKLEQHNLFDCIECGACAFVCPSEIPLVQYYRVAKVQIKEQKAEKAKAERAKERFEIRNRRLEKELAERQNRGKRPAAKVSEQAADAIQAALARTQNTASTSDDSTQDMAAIRAQRKEAARLYKEQKAAEHQDTPSNIESSAIPAEDKKSAVAAAIARAKAKKLAAEQPSDEAEPTPDTGNKDKKAAVAAAIARAKAKKLEAELLSDDEIADSAANDKKAAVAAAIARAKAKKLAAEQPNNEAEALPDTSANDKKAAVAAAIARAKAKKLAAQAQDNAPASTTTDTEVSDSLTRSSDAATPQNELSDADDKKAKVAAAIARAKAKKLAAQAQDNAPASIITDTEVSDNSTRSSDTATPQNEQTVLSDADDKKAKVAAAIARAKAKKLAAQAQDNAPASTITDTEVRDNSTRSSDTATPQNEQTVLSDADDKKAKVAAAIARAKAKKLAAAQQAASPNHSTTEDDTQS